MIYNIPSLSKREELNTGYGSVCPGTQVKSQKRGSSSFYTEIDIHKDRYKIDAHTHTYVELHGKTHTVYLIYTYRCVYNIYI